MYHHSDRKNSLFFIGYIPIQSIRFCISKLCCRGRPCSRIISHLQWPKSSRAPSPPQSSSVPSRSSSANLQSQAQRIRCCRQDIILLHGLPPQGSFDMQNLMDWMGIYPMKKSLFLRSEWWYIHIGTYTRGQDPEVAGSLFMHFDFLNSLS